MEIFDAHCDTVCALLDGGINLSKNDLHIDMERLKKYSAYTQFFAAFISPKYADRAMERATALINKIKSEADKNGIALCAGYDDFVRQKKHIKAFISLEGGEPIQSVGDVKRLFDMGVRMIAPTWNFKNRLACGVLEEEDTGLTPLGVGVIREMCRLGIILDVSHISEKSFWDAAEIFDKPICASHSNLKSVKDNPRNLTDEQLLMIKKSGGVCGINFYPPFFGDDIRDIVRHTDRMLDLGCENNICLGSDFDGVDRLPKGICGAEDTEKVIRLLPYSTKVREKIAFRNLLRVIKAYNC